MRGDLAQHASFGGQYGRTNKQECGQKNTVIYKNKTIQKTSTILHF